MCKSAIAHCTHVSECFLNSHVQPHIAHVCTHLQNSPVVCADCGFWSQFYIELGFWPCSLPSPFHYMVKFNLHEKDLLFWYISHHLHHGIVPVFRMIFTDLQEICSIWAQNWFCYCFWTILRVERLKLVRNDIKNNFALKCCKFLVHLCKSS